MRRTDGFALPLTLAILVVTMLLILSTSVSMINDRANAANDRSASQAEEVAKAGFTQYKTIAFQTFQYYVKNAQVYATSASRSAQCGNLLSIGLDLGRDGIGVNGDANDLLSGQSRTGQIDVGTAKGTYTVTYIVSGSGIVLRSIGQVNGAKATVQGFLSGQNSSAFSNAIFAGAAGQSGKFLNGSGDIYGSIYVEGDPGKDITLDTSGNFGIHNYYQGSTLQTVTGATQTQLEKFLKVQALDQKDMCATVRARYGSIKVDGGSTIGDSTAPDGYKGLMKGVYAGTTATPIFSGANQVYADSTGTFDLDPPPTMPKLDAADTIDKSKLAANVRAAFPLSTPTWRQAMQTDAALNGITVTRTGDSAVAAPVLTGCNIGDLVASDGNGNNASKKLVFGEKAINCTDPITNKGFKYYKNTVEGKDSWILDINGTFDMKGWDVVFSKDIIVRYEGKSTMLVERNLAGQGGNVRIDGDVLPLESFPDKSVLGIVAENDLTISGANQNIDGAPTKTQVVTGFFYAGGTVSAVKDSVVMGTMMGNGFDLSNGTNGGSARTQVFQVPGLEFNLPPGVDALKNTSVPSFAVYSYERK
ncbi:hypothetical protein [Deinococcus radiotolerans]|uniref:Type 4 fimbrial biogenesis protein PilX N-terminal domain-containing protein n=1 Tax=Deinococcus radiotolerans TaxID=1309407 RepID=A0ABQ2FJ49_9DEIO|nr:hypothetical protein [Deinococcus radiotolerans]GGL00847.1 hypothetical protein GCM10010844_19140 [Deinococcus radiotolerans]